MSRAFVREDAGSGAPELPELPVSPNPNWERPAFLARQRAEREVLAAEVARLKAMPAGDRPEDRMPLAIAERDLRWLDARLASAIEVPPAGGEAVALGARVRVADEDGTEALYTLVGEDEAEAKSGLITPFSPLGRALAGAHVGDLVRWPRPSGPRELEVLEITWPPD